MPLKLIEESDIQDLIHLREGEEKIGEKIILGNQLNNHELAEIEADYVLFGVPEDVGPRANLGKSGADSAWDHFLTAFLNVQENQYLSAQSILLLGIIDFRDEANYHSTDLGQLREVVAKIDLQVSELVELIVKAGKIPILIGGGHNNAYGLIEGASSAFNKAINCINLDPHADYRSLEGRHSGNGFSYAKERDYLDKYFICGLHESYNSMKMIDLLHENEDIAFNTFDEIEVRKEKSYEEALQEGLSFVSSAPYGVELDCDSIQHFPVSAKTSTGLTSEQARSYIYKMGASSNACYLHLTEAAPSLDPENAAIWGKLLAYLVSDFIKAKNSIH